MPRKVKHLLKSAGMTAADVAEKVGIGASTLRNWADGRTGMSAEKVKRVADFLKLTPEEVDAEDNELRETGPGYGVRPLLLFTDEELLDKAMSVLKDQELPAAERARRVRLFLEAILDRDASPEILS